MRFSHRTIKRRQYTATEQSGRRDETIAKLKEQAEHWVGKLNAQDPNGAYAAVIPKWTAALLKGEPVFINGDGETSRDFTYVANALQANLLAATSTAPKARDQVYNVAVGDRTTLNGLFHTLRISLVAHGVALSTQPHYRDFRVADVRHSKADVGKARTLLGYQPSHRLDEGVAQAMPWYVGHQQTR